MEKKTLVKLEIIKNALRDLEEDANSLAGNIEHLLERMYTLLDR